jgi:hypothetical protein
MKINSATKLSDAITSIARAQLMNFSDDPLADLMSQQGCEVLLQAGRPQPQWVRGDLHRMGSERP